MVSYNLLLKTKPRIIASIVPPCSIILFSPSNINPAKSHPIPQLFFKLLFFLNYQPPTPSFTIFDTNRITWFQRIGSRSFGFSQPNHRAPDLSYIFICLFTSLFLLSDPFSVPKPNPQLIELLHSSKPFQPPIIILKVYLQTSPPLPINPPSTNPPPIPHTNQPVSTNCETHSKATETTKIYLTRYH